MAPRGKRMVNSLDPTDLRILKALGADARVSNRRLAQLVNLSESACYERVRALERRGVIVGYHAIVAPKAGDVPFAAWADISLAAASINVHHACLEYISACPHVLAAYQVAGTLGLLVHFAGGDLDAFKAFCGEIEKLGVDRSRIRFGVVTRRITGET